MVVMVVPQCPSDLWCASSESQLGGRESRVQTSLEATLPVSAYEGSGDAEIGRLGAEMDECSFFTSLPDGLKVKEATARSLCSTIAEGNEVHWELYVDGSYIGNSSGQVGQLFWLLLIRKDIVNLGGVWLVQLNLIRLKWIGLEPSMKEIFRQNSRPWLLLKQLLCEPNDRSQFGLTCSLVHELPGIRSHLIQLARWLTWVFF